MRTLAKRTAADRPPVVVDVVEDNRFGWPFVERVCPLLCYVEDVQTGSIQLLRSHSGLEEKRNEPGRGHYRDLIRVWIALMQSNEVN